MKEAEAEVVAENLAIENTVGVDTTVQDKVCYRARLKSNLITIIVLSIGTAIFLTLYMLNQSLANSDYFFMLPAVFMGCFALFAIIVRYDIKGFASNPSQSATNIKAY